MPCTDGGVPYPPSREEVLNEKVPAAVLCALIRRMTVKEVEALLNHTDWKQAGVTRNEFMEWWRNHQQRDQEREAAAKQMADRDRLRKSARGKLRKHLSPAEIEALNLASDDLDF